MSKPYLVTKKDMREITVLLSWDGEVTEDQIEELIDAWNEFREPGVNVSDILWALKRAEAFHHRKIVKLWCS